MRRLAFAFALTLALVLAGCPKKHAADDAGASASSAAPFEVKDSSEGLLFTWIDEKGDFHVEQKAADVPMAGRDAVRVVDPARDEGTHADKVFVADLRAARPDGTYATHTSTKAEFDQIAVERRKAHASAVLVETDGATTAPVAGNTGSAGDPSINAAGRPAVIIYGAEWCGACHEAAAYCRKKNIPFVEKDIEADRGAAQEMKAKLAKSGLRSGSIPVIDVRGKVMVGFNPQAIDDALGKAL